MKTTGTDQKGRKRDRKSSVSSAGRRVYQAAVADKSMYLISQKGGGCGIMHLPGRIDISLPKYHSDDDLIPAGLYSYTRDNSTPVQFSSFRLNARNVSDEEMDLTNGNIDLIFEYRHLNDGNPFETFSFPLPSMSETMYIKSSQSVSSIPRDGGIDIEFSLFDNPLPINAVDLRIYVRYSDTNGENFAYGFEDVSEPTSLRFFNSQDMICISQEWYEAGTTVSLGMMDIDGDDKPEFDVFKHDTDGFWVKFSSKDVLMYPVEFEDIAIDGISAGDHRDIFFITNNRDIGHSYSISDVGIQGVDGEYPAGETCYDTFSHDGRVFNKTIWTNTALKHQIDCNTGSYPITSVRWYPIFHTFRGCDYYNGIIFFPYSWEGCSTFPTQEICTTTN